MSIIPYLIWIFLDTIYLKSAIIMANVCIFICNCCCECDYWFADKICIMWCNLFRMHYDHDNDQDTSSKNALIADYEWGQIQFQEKKWKHKLSGSSTRDDCWRVYHCRYEVLVQTAWVALRHFVLVSKCPSTAQMLQQDFQFVL